MSIEDYVYVGKYKYKTEDLLGCGYYGKVYKGCKTEDETFIVAIKVSKKTPESDYELYAIKKLMDNPHDNIVIFYDCYERLNELVLVMEYCNGGTLDEYKEEAHIDFKTINIFMLMLAKAIKHLKSLGIVHRDLKPDNILLKKDFGATPTLKIADFGTARWIGITGHPDPCPISPYAADFTENCSEVVFEPVDNFSLGRICWSLVRRQPHSNSPERSKLQKIINGLEKVAAKRMTVEEVIRILSFQPNNDEHPYDDEQPNDDNSMLAAESSVFAGTSSEFAGTSSEFAGTSSEFAGTSSKFVAISSICTSIFGLIILTKIGTPGFIIALVALVLAMVLIIELAFSFKRKREFPLLKQKKIYVTRA